MNREKGNLENKITNLIDQLAKEIQLVELKEQEIDIKKTTEYIAKEKDNIKKLNLSFHEKLNEKTKFIEDLKNIQKRKI